MLGRTYDANDRSSAHLHTLLIAEEKARNREISRVRIQVEYAISGVKRYRIVKDTLRNWNKGFRDQVMETCCGLHNF